MIGGWGVTLGFVLVAICVASLHILRLHRESQDRQLWLQEMAERREERAERREERAERREERARRYRAPDPREFMEEGAYW